MHQILRIFLPVISFYYYKIEKTESQHDKIEYVTGLVWLSLFIDGTGKCKLPSTPHLAPA
jgi:hypothetical protein